MNGQFKKLNCFLQPLAALGGLVILLLANLPIGILLDSGMLTGVNSFTITMGVRSVILSLAVMFFLSGVFCTVFAVKCSGTNSAEEFELKNTYIYILNYLNSFLLLFAGVFTLVAIKIITYYAIFSGFIISPFEDFVSIAIYYPILLVGAAVSFLLGFRTKKIIKVAPF